MSYRSIVELLRRRAETQAERLAFRFLTNTNGEAHTLDYGTLDQRARAIASVLKDAELEGECALLLYPPGLEYITAYFGCLYAGVIAVPCYPPGLTRASAEAVKRIAVDSNARAVLTLTSWRGDPKLLALLKEANVGMSWIHTDSLPPGAEDEWVDPRVDGNDLAFLQYTSGSTGDPKGVMVSHGNLLANLQMIQRSFDVSSDDHACFWLPPYHDMGLIGGVLGGLYANCQTTLMAPATFMRSPIGWLHAISRGRCTISGAPNFAYDRCVEKLREDPESGKGLDLSCLEIMFSGAEMVRADTLSRFIDAFGPYGFRPESLMPCYGMAETTLLVTSAPRMRGHMVKPIERKVFDDEKRAQIATNGKRKLAWNLVGCGSAASDTRIRIVDPDTLAPCAEGQVGEVWVHSPSVAQGYWGRPEVSAQLFRAKLAGDVHGYLRTGDRGFFLKDELFIAGRMKDVLIVRGKNYAAEDVEASARSAHAAIKPHRCAAIVNETGEREELIVLLECEGSKLAGDRHAALAQVMTAVRRSVLETQGLELDDVVVVKAGELPVTTSGKLKRRACAEKFGRSEMTVLDRLVGGAPVKVPSSAPLLANKGPETLEKLRQIVARHAKVDIAPDAKLSELGLDSVKATELSVEISDAFGIELPPSALSPDSTLLQLAAFLSADNTQNAPDRQAVEINGKPSPLLKDKPSLPERLQSHAIAVNTLKNAGVLNFNLVQNEKLSSTDSIVEGEAVSFFSSYSYMGLNQHPAIIRAKVHAITKFGTGSHGVMMLGGYTAEHKRLESELARNFRTDDALLYSSGYMANLAAIDTLVDRQGVIYCDMLVHTSILDGCRLSGADVKMFPHQDADALGRMLARRPAGQAALVIVDGVYSLRGEIANLPAILKAAHEHGAIVMVDEAHALGGVGHNGRGTAEHHGVEGRVDLFTGGLGKAIPAYGGFVAGRRDIIDYLRFRSSPYVYSGGMDAANVAAARTALELMAEDPSIMQRLRDNITLMETLLAKKGIPCLRWGSPCMPVVCRDDVEAYALSREMRRRGFYIAPIVYPAVPRDQQGLRLTVTAGHTPEQIKQCVDELDDALTQIRHHLSLAHQKTQKQGPEAMTKNQTVSPYTPIPDALEAFAKGQLLVVSDDEDRENEGDLIVAAEYASPAAINFMITHGRGLVCLAISPEIAEQKKLKPMVERNEDHMGTAFTVSIDAAPAYGITTGISAPERARTVQVLISEQFGPETLRAPGHMFPLIAKEGGLAVRQGHTEAGVDLARLCGLEKHASVIVEIIKEDGEMARRDDLIVFAQKHKLPYITIAQLREYMAQNDQKVARAPQLEAQVAAE